MTQSSPPNGGKFRPNSTQTKPTRRLTQPMDNSVIAPLNPSICKDQMCNGGLVSTVNSQCSSGLCYGRSRVFTHSLGWSFLTLAHSSMKNLKNSIDVWKRPSENCYAVILLLCGPRRPLSVFQKC